jgi:hypothetical protein
MGEPASAIRLPTGTFVEFITLGDGREILRPYGPVTFEAMKLLASIVPAPDRYVRRGPPAA